MDKKPSAQLIQREVDRRISAAMAEVDKGDVPNSDEIETLERLTKLRDLVGWKATPKKPRWEIGLLALLALVLAILISIHLSSSPVELDMKVTRIALTLNHSHSDSLLPGESGEVLALKSAEISGAEQVDPPSDGSGGTLILRAHKAEKDKATKGDLSPVLLQEVTIPRGIDSHMVLSVAYDANLHGLALESSGSQLTSALLSVPVSDSPHADADPRHVVSVEGKHLAMRIFPTAERSITVFRNTPVSEIRFDTESAGHSSVLEGKVILKEKANGSNVLDPGDFLNIASDEPMLLREVSLDSGALRVRVAIPKASHVYIGPKDLMPSLFDWVYYRWPAQIYGCACALIAVWLTFRKWWTDAA